MTVDPRPALEWIGLRDAARAAKKAGREPPYSDDPIVRTYRFCNVRREDDRVTTWIRKEVRERYAGHPHLWFMLCVCRIFNWPPTLQTLIDGGRSWPAHQDFSPAMMLKAVAAVREQKRKVFTGAYVIPPAVGMADKAEGVCLRTLGDLWRNANAIRHRFDAHMGARLQDAHETLTTFNGWGPFLAYQAVVDMRFCPGLLKDAKDRDGWAAAGPGTVRGLNRLHGRPVDAALRQPQALEEIRELFPVFRTAAGRRFDFSDVPNVLCETDKFLRARNGEGKPRALYVPNRGY